jgi:hypothetical protein
MALNAHVISLVSSPSVVSGLGQILNCRLLDPDFRVARQNEAARAADAAAWIDPSVGTVLLKNGWGRR